MAGELGVEQAWETHNSLGWSWRGLYQAWLTGIFHIRVMCARGACPAG